MRFERLEEWLDWQETLHPTGMHLGLGRCRWLKTQLGWERLPFPVVMVAGTNGKGSTVAFLDALYQAGGYRTGTYTSPHLVRYNERIQVSGEEARDDAIMRAFARVDEARGETVITYFEFGTFAAVDIFLRAQVDIAILEVGIGGRLDAVNVFDPDVSVITPIGIDHVKWLGPSRESAGREKAGIMRKGKPTVISDSNPPRSLSRVAREIDSIPFQLGEAFRIQREKFHWDWYGPDCSHLKLPYPSLLGSFQISNAAGAIMVTECLAERLPLAIRHLREGIGAAHILGRFQVVPGEPSVILDVAHNPHAAKVLANSLARNPCAGLTRVVVGMLADKEHSEVLAPLVGLADGWYVAGLADTRGVDAETLSTDLCKMVTPDVVHVHDDVISALLAALDASACGDQVLVFGSFYTVGEAIEKLPIWRAAPGHCEDCHG